MVGYLFQFRIFISIQLERKGLGPLFYFLVVTLSMRFLFLIYGVCIQPLYVLSGGHLRLVIKGFSVIHEYFIGESYYFQIP